MDKEIAEKINRKVIRSFMPEEVLSIINTKNRELIEITRDLKRGSPEDMEILARREKEYRGLKVPHVVVEKPTSRTPMIIIMKERRV